MVEGAFAAAGDSAAETGEKGTQGLAAAAPRLPGWRFLGAVQGGAYGIFETPGGLLLLHRGAARSRLRCDEVRRALRAETPARQALLLPEPFELTAGAAAALEAHDGFLREVGYAAEPFGRLVFRLAEAPAWVAPEEAVPLLEELLDGLRERWLDPAGAAQRARDEVARLAAKRARGRPEEGFSPARWDALAAQLFQCADPLTDAEGRPTVREFTWGELAKGFRGEGR